MNTGTIYAAVPAVAAAVGFYFFDRNYAKVRKTVQAYVFVVVYHG